MSVVLSFAAGVAFVMLCLTASTTAEADTLVPRTVLPDWVHTLTAHGMRVRVIPTSPVVALTKRVRSTANGYLDDVARWVMSPVVGGEFTSWWEETWTNERKRMYHGRRRYDEMSRTPQWRNRWAEYDTQNWPTLATSGNAWDLVPTLTAMHEKALVICTGMTFNTTTQVMPVEHVARNLSESPRLLHCS